MRRTLPQLVRRWRVMALVRRRDPALAALGVTQIEGDLDQPQTLARLSGISDAVIHSAPPPTEGKGDPRTARLLALLQRGKSLPRRLIYISTSGVYGDCGGARVDETHAIEAKSARAARRVDAERRLRRFGRRQGGACRVSILRAPGIYAGDRLPLERLRRGLPLMRPTLGRCVDYFVLADGTTITPYDLTCAIEHLPGLARYQIIQRSSTLVEVLVQPGHGYEPSVGTAIRSALQAVLHGLIPEVRLVDRLAPEPSGKFRIVRSELGVAMAADG